MRRSCHNIKFIEIDGTVVGVCLGSDFCSEHEIGVAGMLTLLKVDGNDSGSNGLDRWRIKKPQNIGWTGFRDDKHLGAGMLLCRWPALGKVTEPIEASSADCKPTVDYNSGAIRSDSPLSASWDKDGFAVVGWTDDAMCKLAELYEALCQGHGIFMLTNSAGLGNAGPTLFRVDLHPEIWAEEDRKQRIEQEAHKANLDEWQTSSEGLYDKLCEMEAAVRECLGETYNMGFRFPAYSLPLRRPDGSWTNRPRFQGNRGELRVWLNPTHQSLWSCGWVNLQDIKDWSEGKGKIWPLGAAMPGGEHPFWAQVKKSLPEPDDNKQWSDTFPWSVSSVYSSGDYLWNHLSQRLGFFASGSAGSYPYVTHELFAADIEAAAKNGLTAIGEVKDRQKLNETVADWNASCSPEHRFEPQFFGRGESLVQRLQEAKMRIRRRNNMES